MCFSKTVQQLRSPVIPRSVADDMLLNPECCSFSWLHTCTHCHRSLLQKKKCYPIVHFITGNVEVKMLSGPGWHLWVKMHIQMQADFHSRDVRHNDTYKQTPKHCSEQAFFPLFLFFFFLLVCYWIQHNSISVGFWGENNFQGFQYHEKRKEGFEFLSFTWKKVQKFYLHYLHC